MEEACFQVVPMKRMTKRQMPFMILLTDEWMTEEKKGGTFTVVKIRQCIVCFKLFNIIIKNFMFAPVPVCQLYPTIQCTLNTNRQSLDFEIN